MSHATVSFILNQRPGLRFRPETIRKVWATAKRLGYDLSRLNPKQRRRDPRRPVDLPVRVTIRLKDGTVYDQGTARLYDFSASGVLAGDFTVAKASLPLKPFTLDLAVESSRLAGITMRCRPVRFAINGTLALGLQCERMPARARARLHGLVNQTM